ncbi:hypothetical protein D3C80_2058010 [compost metagenome]
MAFSARRPIQLLATECAPKKPKVNTSMPTITSSKGLNKVSNRPLNISRMVPQNTLRRPSLSARAPICAEL